MGGLGPLATAQFLEAVARQTEEETDQEHIDMLVSQHSSTPDRTAYLFDESLPNPEPVMVRDAQMLEQCGADFLVLTCNTGHAFSDAIRNSVNIELLGILEATAKNVQRRAPSGAHIGLLATDGTLKSHLYQEALERLGFQVVVPEAEDQRVVMKLIYEQVKAGGKDELGELIDVLQRLEERGVTHFVLGCTELSVAADELELLHDPRIIDSLQSLVEATIQRANRHLHPRVRVAVPDWEKISCHLPALERYSLP